MRGTLTLVAAGIVAALLSGCKGEPPTPPGTAPGGVADSAQSGPIPPGQDVFNQWCLGCHAPMPGRGAPPRGLFPPAGTMELERRYHGTLPAALEQRTDLTPGLIRSVVRQGVGIMPPTRKSEITDDELDQLSAWLTRKKAE